MRSGQEQKTAADEERMLKKQDVKDAQGSKAEDLAFAKKVKEKCAAKEQEWEKRQQTRSDETQAVDEAIKVLDSDSSHELFGRTTLLQLASKEPTRQDIYERLRAAGKQEPSINSKAPWFVRIFAS